jgi:hypothetical protein
MKSEQAVLPNPCLEEEEEEGGGGGGGEEEEEEEEEQQQQQQQQLTLNSDKTNFMKFITNNKICINYSML